jgi:hypothetical protein
VNYREHINVILIQQSDTKLVTWIFDDSDQDSLRNVGYCLQIGEVYSPRKLHFTCGSNRTIYRVFRAQADWTLTHTNHKDTEQSTIEATITLDGVTLTDSLIRWSPNEWPSVFRELPVSADKMFWTSNKPAQWTLCIIIHCTVCLQECRWMLRREYKNLRNMTLYNTGHIQIIKPEIISHI